jgi:formylglycine-generating enzyme required for sulfatase activity
MLQVARIAAGEFAMGADDGDEDERPAHKAYLDEYCIGTYPVTNGEYGQFLRETGYPSPAIRALPLMVTGALEADFRSLAAAYSWKNGTPPEGRDRHPVTLIGFEDATAYCGWLATKTGKPVRLPTEAEWEKAGRGGLDGKLYQRGDTLDPAHANFHPEVGSYPPNGFHLFDMSGNVWEWVSDWYAPNYYPRAQYLNPQGPDSGLMRIVRGGAWLNADGRYLRCAYRHKVPPDSYAYSIGFRVAHSLR